MQRRRHARRAFLEARDDVAIQEFLRASGKDVNRADYAKLDRETVTFMSIPYIVGSYETVAKHLDRVAAQGVRGVCLSFPDFSTEVKIFADEVLPHMSCRDAEARPALPNAA